MKPRYFLTCCLTMIAVTAFFLSFQTVFALTSENGEEALGRKLAKQAVKGSKRWSTINHKKIEALNKDFTSGEEITKVCLSCHSEAASQFHKTIHWTWLASGDKSDIRYGRKD